MLATPPNQRVDSLVSAAIVIILVGVCLASVAFAGLTATTVDPVAIVADNGRHLIVTGPIMCTAGETASLPVTLTQRATGAVAQGLTRLTCTDAS